MERLLASWMAAGLLAGLGLAVVELAALGSLRPDLVLAVVGLLPPLGFVTGTIIAAVERLIARRPRTRLVATLVRSLPALPALIFLGRHLFEGARAATLPGASAASAWVPIAGLVGLGVAIALGGRVLIWRGWRPRVALATALCALALVLEGANRRLFVTGYPDLHLFLILATAVVLTVGLGIALGADAPWPIGTPAVVGAPLTVSLIVVALSAAAGRGLVDRQSRARAGTHGSHLRHMARLGRALLDRDRDGFSPILGGGDCDDGRAAINPGASEVAGNRVDEDCDGQDLAASAAPVAAPVVSSLAVSPSTPATTARAAPPPAAAAPASWLGSRRRAELVARTRDMNVLVVSVDALRADALVTTDAPRLTQLADRGASFARAYSPGAGTDLALGAFVSGRIDPWSTIPRTLPEALRAGGRATHALMPREVLRYAGRTLITRGVTTVEEIANDRARRDVSSGTSSVETTDRALAALERLSRGDRPWFLWVHYFDVHEHMQIPSSDAALRSAAAGRDLGVPEAKYRALLALTDREAARLLDGVAARGQDARTIVVLFGDHGESLGEDPRLPENHGRFVYEPLVRIPLVIAVPGLAPTAPIAAVSLYDLAPTLLDLVDEAPLPGQWGRSLAPVIAGEVPDPGEPPRVLPLFESEQWGVVRWPLKLLVRPSDNLVELYDVERDPRERADLAGARPEDVDALKALHAGFPVLDFDRTQKGRARREALARPPAGR